MNTREYINELYKGPEMVFDVFESGIFPSLLTEGTFPEILIVKKCFKVTYSTCGSNNLVIYLKMYYTKWVKIYILCI